VTSIVPELAVRDGRAAIEFYISAFGAVEEYRVGGTDDEPSVVAQLSAGGAAFWVSDAGPANGTVAPGEAGGVTARMLLVVDEPAAVVARAAEAGATVLKEVGEEHGWLLGRLLDPFGQQWEVGRPLRAWPPGSPGGHAA
jgi:PhnB protein